MAIEKETKTEQELLAETFFPGAPEARTRAWLDKASALALGFLYNRERGKLHGELTLPELEAAFGETAAPQAGTPFEAVLREIQDRVVSQSVHVADPWFVGHMTGTIPYFALPIELIATALNQNVVKIETALSASFVEGQTLAWMHRLVYGRDDAFYARHMHSPEVALGVVTSGGTIGNLTSLAVARNKMLPDAHEHGLAEAMERAGCGKLLVAASKRAHYSLRKSAGILGLGASSLIEIPVCGRSNEMDIGALEKLLRERLGGDGRTRLLAIVGVAGTTETGSVDPLGELARIAKAHGAWFHVDAAWGAPLLCSPTQRSKFAGIEEADSVVMDGHKLFHLPMSHGMTVFKDPGSLRALEHHARYILRTGSVDLGRHTIEGSRRFDSLKMWAFLKSFGLDGYARMADASVALAERFAEMVRAHPAFQLTSEVRTNILTYRFVPPEWQASLSEKTQDEVPPEEISRYANSALNEINVDLQKQQRVGGRSFVSRTTLESVSPGQETVVLRVVLFNPLTTPAILADILEEQQELGTRIFRSRAAAFKKEAPPGTERWFPSD